MKPKIRDYFNLILFIAVCVLFYKLWGLWGLGFFLLGVAGGLVYTLRKRNAEREKIFKDRIAPAIKKSVEETRKLNNNDPVTDGEMREYYQKYLNKKNRDDRSEWNTEEPMTYDEYKETAYKYIGGPRRYCVVMKTDAFISNPDGTQEYMSFGE